MTQTEINLRNSVTWLPEPVRRAMRLALSSGWYTIEPNDYESGTGVCPYVAAAKCAGVWRDGHAGDGGPDWGTETEPNGQCFGFAVSFDLYADEAGTESAVELVLEELTPRSLLRAA